MGLDEVGASPGSCGVGGAGALLSQEAVLAVYDPTLESEIIFEGIPPDEEGSPRSRSAMLVLNRVESFASAACMLRRKRGKPESPRPFGVSERRGRRKERVTGR